MSTKRNQSNRAKKAGLFVLLNVVILFFLIVGFGREYVSNIQIQREIREREAERTALLDEQADTLLLIEQLKSEYYLEKEARVKHGLGKEGETMILVQDGTNAIPYGQDGLYDADDESQDIENPTKWYYYFFDRNAFETM